MVYFLKVNIAIALFYAFYRLFFYKDTFFVWRRTALMCFFAVSAAVPLFNIQAWITQQEPMVAMADLYAAVVLPEITLTPQPQMDWKQLLAQVFSVVYWLVVALLALRFVVQLVSIVRLARRCPVQEIDGTAVHLLPREEGPFSFFRWIFVCPGAHSSEELNEILTHERTHVRQCHSIDVMVGELACIVCWFNPFAWLMKREIRTNLEYMADEKVLETGHDSRTYQYHLLGLSHHKAAANIYNSFNVLPLKRRITMMNKRRTREIGRTKYLMFLPLAALLMIVSNIEAVARTTQKIASEVIESVKSDETTTVQPQSQSAVSPQTQTAVSLTQQGKPEKVTYKGKIVDEAGNSLGDVQIVTDRKFQSSTVSTVNTNGEFRVETSSEAGMAFIYTGKDGRTLGWAGNAEDLAKMDPNNMVIVLKAQHVINAPSASGDEDVFEVAEQMPQFPNGGIPGMMKYLSENIRYPEAAVKAGKQGRVIVLFVVDKDGSITNVKTMKGVDAELDKEAVRVVSAMPKWIPGMQKGKAVRVKYTVPVTFRLPNASVAGKVNDMAVGVAVSSDNVTGDVAEAVEQMPEFPGGMPGLMQYISKNLRYPEDAKAKGIQGRVTVRVVVNTEGKVTNAKVIRGVSPSLDAEALRVASSLPNWKPGMQAGKAVNVKYVFPVTFSLQ